MPDPKGNLVTPIAFTVAGKLVALLSDDAGHLQLDIISSTLPALAATAAKQLANNHNVIVTALPAGLATTAKQLPDGHNVVASATDLDIRDLVHTQDNVLNYGKDEGGTARIIRTDAEGRLETVNSMHTTAKARAYLSSPQAITTATETKVALDAATYDPSNIVDTTNNKVIAKVAGYYQLTYVLTFVGASVVADRWLQSAIKIEGAYSAFTNLHTVVVQPITAVGSDISHLNVDDEVEFWIYHNFGANGDLEASETQTYLTIHLLSAD